MPFIVTDNSSSEEESKKGDMKQKKPIYLRDIEREELLEKGRLVQGAVRIVSHLLLMILLLTFV